MRSRMLADVHTLQIQLLQRRRTLNRKSHTRRHIRKSKPELIQQLRRDRISMRNQQTPVMNVVHIVR